jgi:hypothetical protein
MATAQIALSGLSPDAVQIHLEEATRKSLARPRAAVLFVAVLIISLAGCGRTALGAQKSGAQKMAACIERSKQGWHRVTHAFQIKKLGHLDLMTAWVGGPEEEEKGSL